MKRTLDDRESAGNWTRLAVVLAAGLVLSACTSVPEWADPTEWFEGEDPAPERISAAKDLEQAKSGDFPNLASVPNTPRTASTASERADVAKGLAADNANANYSSERLVASGSGAAAAPAPPAAAQGLGAAPAPAAPAPKFAAPAPKTATAKAPSGTQIIQPPAPSFQPARAAPAAVQAPRTSELAAILYFADGSHTLDANDRSILRDIVALSRERNARIRVIGHASARTANTDPVAHRIANLEISQRRAEAVAAALVRLGATRDKVRAEARADSLPVYHEFMPSGEAGNRRTEIFLEY